MSAAAIWGTALLSSSVIAALITWLGTRKTSEASATEVLVRTSTSLLEPLRAEIEALRAEVLALRAETEQCHRERDVDRARLRIVEQELARYKAGPTASYDDNLGETP